MIGIFDSGLGGLTVVKEIFRVAPNAPILYLGDLARMPYGTKSKETICKYAEEDVNFLLKHGATSIVIACNTASGLAFDFLKSKFLDIPIFEVITPAAKEACEISPNGRIGIIGTRATVESKIYEQRISFFSASARVYGTAAPLLVPLIEEGLFEARETKLILKKYLYPLRRAGIDTLILGCTHFPLIKKLIQHRIGRRVNIVDSAECVVQELKQSLQASNSKFLTSKFFVTDLTPHWQSIAEKWLGREIRLEVVNL